ncbi:mitochondrial coenzyme A diphosphatase NUDT8-like [Plodia interpunctella]|uniref:mitochondrial coenzyme A diphosphatase NUDT8-like n=1 Tax=Plodia interpunctella TaxID=58824 RepID=UPI00236774B0|nr:mitochondrial coenzyme A diphosphatase NUDT8-like [Plodia interpunctella]
MCAKANSLEGLFNMATRQQCMTKIKRYPAVSLSKLRPDSEAVLVPLCRVDGIPSILYTVRSQHLWYNKGEIAFPGGVNNKKETLIETALRHTEEDIGLKPDKIDIWGNGPAFPGRDNKILVTPVIASVDRLTDADLNVNNKKVAEVFTVAIEVLCDPNNQFASNCDGFLLPVFAADKYIIRGLTAYITHVLLNCALSKDVYNNDILKRKKIMAPLK